MIFSPQQHFCVAARIVPAASGTDQRVDHFFSIFDAANPYIVKQRLFI